MKEQTPTELIILNVFQWFYNLLWVYLLYTFILPNWFTLPELSFEELIIVNFVINIFV